MREVASQRIKVNKTQTRKYSSFGCVGRQLPLSSEMRSSLRVSGSASDKQEPVPPEGGEAGHLVRSGRWTRWRQMTTQWWILFTALVQFMNWSLARFCCSDQDEGTTESNLYGQFTFLLSRLQNVHKAWPKRVSERVRMAKLSDVSIYSTLLSPCKW
jgi:hypothetical protein